MRSSQRDTADRAATGRKDPFRDLLILSALAGSGVSFSKIYLVHVLFLAAAARLTGQIVRGRTFVIRILPYAPFLWMVFWLGFLLPLAPDPTGAVIRLAIIAFCVLLLISTGESWRSRSDVLRFRRLLLGFGGAEMTLGLGEALGIWRWPISPFSRYVTYFGRKPGVGEDAGTEVLAYVSSMPTGFHWNPNEFAIFLVMLLPFLMTCENRLVRYTSPAVVAFLVVAAGSRLVALAFVLTIVCLVILNRHWWRPAFLITSVSAGLLLVSLPTVRQYALQADTPIKRKLTEVLHTVDALVAAARKSNSESSVSLRRELTAHAWNAARDSWFVGNGPGSALVAQSEWQRYRRRVITSTHNFWLELLVEGGLPVLLPFLFWYGWILYRLREVAASSPEVGYLIARPLLVALLVFPLSAIGASSVAYFLPMWVIFGYATAVVRLGNELAYES